MQKIFLIFSLLFCTHCEGQDHIESLRKKAFDFFIEGNHYDSALFYYKIMANYDPCDIYLLSQIGKSYNRLNDPGNAKKYFLRALDLYETDNFRLFFSSIALDLADIYITERNFEEALLCLEYSQTKYKSRRTMCMAGFGAFLRLNFAYKKALCLSGVGRKHDAIKSLLPRIFTFEFENQYDSTEYDKMSQFFASTVGEVYGKENACKMMLQSVQHAFYNVTQKLETKARPLTYEVQCYVYYLDCKIDLNTSAYTDFEKDEPLPAMLYKDAILKAFTNSRAYYYLTHPSCCIATTDRSREQTVSFLW